MHRHQRKTQNKVKNNGMKKESNSACGQHRGPFHDCRKCQCNLLIHHCPPPFPWGEKARPEAQKVVSAHSVKFYSMSAIASTVLSPWQMSTNQAIQNLWPPWLFPSVVSSSLWDSRDEENLGLGPSSRTGLEKGLFSQFYRLSTTSPWAWSKVRQGTALGVLGRDLHRAGWGLSLLGLHLQWVLKGLERKTWADGLWCAAHQHWVGRRENPWWSLGILPRVAVGMKFLCKYARVWS